MVAQIVLWIVDSGCSKHMTGDLSLLKNCVEKFMGTGIGHNLFSVRQFCDGDLEVAFRSKTCYVRNLEGDDLLKGAYESNLYTISISDMAASSPVCLMSKASLTKSWLWHRRLSHLNFSTINDLTKHDMVDGLLKFKYDKDHICSACEQGTSRKAYHPPKLVPCTHSKLDLIHIDLYRPMRVESINGKKYILVIVDDYSRYTWAHYEKLGIMQQFSIARTPQQIGVVERCNRTFVKAASTMLIFSKSPEFLWTEAISTAYFTQNHSLIHTRSLEDSKAKQNVEIVQEHLEDEELDHLLKGNENVDEDAFTSTNLGFGHSWAKWNGHTFTYLCG
ncbi:retrovirus-related pol polyprotein from transposon TNT 1-94 [Tanacetum coccineum]